MFSTIRIITLLVALLAAVAAVPAQVTSSTDRPVSVAIELLSSHFAIGEPVSMNIRTDRDAWVYVFSTDAHGTTRQIFPNGHHRDNHLRGVRSVRLPSSSYGLVATGPEGNATISAFATTQQFDWLRSYDLVGVSGEPFPVRLTTPVQFRARLEESIAASRRALDAPRQSVPSRAIMGGAGGMHVESASAWRISPSCGYSTRLITITRPIPRSPIVIHDGFFGSLMGDGTSFSYSTGRGSISSGTTIYYPSRVPSYDPPIHHYPYHRPPSYFSYDPYHPPAYSPPRYRDPIDDRRVRLTTTTIRSSPSSASVKIDGRYWGQTPLTVRLPPGTYEICLERDGYRPEYERVRIREGRTESFRFTLDRARRR